MIRIRCDAKEAQCPLGDKFGCDAQYEARSLMLVAKDLQLQVDFYLNYYILYDYLSIKWNISQVVGISFHVGSGCRDFLAYNRAILASRQLFDYGQSLDFRMRLLDIGGGFPGDDDRSFQEVHPR